MPTPQKSDLIARAEELGLQLDGTELSNELVQMIRTAENQIKEAAAAQEPEWPENVVVVGGEDKTAPVEDDQIDLKALIKQQAAMMQQMANALTVLSQNQGSGGNEVLAAALARLTEANIEGSKLIASETRRANRPSNEVVPMISVFNRRGQLLPDNADGPRKPHLKCLMMIPWLVEWESVTREEAELLNLLEAGDYMIKRIDNSKVRVTVKIEYHTDGKRPSRLLLNHDTAFNNDNFRLVPDLVSMLRQVLKQHDPEVALLASRVMSDEEEEAMIEAGRLSISA